MKQNIEKDNKITDELEKILNDYQKIQGQYLSENEQLIKIFNSFKGLITVFEKKMKDDAELSKKLISIIDKAKSEIIHPEKLKELAIKQARIAIEYHKLKKGLDALNDIDINSVLSEMNKKELNNNINQNNNNNNNYNYNYNSNNEENDNEEMKNLVSKNNNFKRQINLKLPNLINNINNSNKKSQQQNLIKTEERKNMNINNNEEKIHISSYLRRRSSKNKRKNQDPFVTVKGSNYTRRKKLTKEKAKSLILKGLV